MSSPDQYDDEGASMASEMHFAGTLEGRGLSDGKAESRAVRRRRQIREASRRFRERKKQEQDELQRELQATRAQVSELERRLVGAHGRAVAAEAALARMREARLVRKRRKPARRPGPDADSGAAVRFPEGALAQKVSASPRGGASPAKRRRVRTGSVADLATAATAPAAAPEAPRHPQPQAATATGRGESKREGEGAAVAEASGGGTPESSTSSGSCSSSASDPSTPSAMKELRTQVTTLRSQLDIARAHMAAYRAASEARTAGASPEPSTRERRDGESGRPLRAPSATAPAPILPMVHPSGIPGSAAVATGPAGPAAGPALPGSLAAVWPQEWRGPPPPAQAHAALAAQAAQAMWMHGWPVPLLATITRGGARGMPGGHGPGGPWLQFNPTAPPAHALAAAAARPSADMHMRTGPYGPNARGRHSADEGQAAGAQADSAPVRARAHGIAQAKKLRPASVPGTTLEQQRLPATANARSAALPTTLNGAPVSAKLLSSTRTAPPDSASQRATDLIRAIPALRTPVLGSAADGTAMPALQPSEHDIETVTMHSLASVDSNRSVATSRSSHSASSASASLLDSASGAGPEDGDENEQGPEQQPPPQQRASAPPRAAKRAGAHLHRVAAPAAAPRASSETAAVETIRLRAEAGAQIVIAVDAGVELEAQMGGEEEEQRDEYSCSPVFPEPGDPTLDAPSLAASATAAIITADSSAPAEPSRPPAGPAAAVAPTDQPDAESDANDSPSSPGLGRLSAVPLCAIADASLAQLPHFGAPDFGWGPVEISGPGFTLQTLRTRSPLPSVRLRALLRGPSYAWVARVVWLALLDSDMLNALGLTAGLAAVRTLGAGLADLRLCARFENFPPHPPHQEALYLAARRETVVRDRRTFFALGRSVSHPSIPSAPGAVRGQILEGYIVHELSPSSVEFVLCVRHDPRGPVPDAVRDGFLHAIARVPALLHGLHAQFGPTLFVGKECL